MDKKFDPNRFLVPQEDLSDTYKGQNAAINHVYELEDNAEEITELPDSRSSSNQSFGANKYPVTVEEAYELCGGYGRFQKVLSTLVILTMISSMFFLFSLAFLEAEPKYYCTADDGTEYSCDSDVFCANETIQWRINWDDNESIDNFIIQYGLYCDAEITLGFIGSIFLFGIVIGSMTLPRFGDIYGRKPIFIIGMSIQVTVTVPLLFLTNIYLAYVVVFLIGFSVTGKQFVGFSYLLEMQPGHKQTFTGTLEFIAEGLVYVAVTIYFAFVCKTWEYVMIPTIVLGVAGTIVLFFLPESPRFLVEAGKFDQARDVFMQIARFNKKNSVVVHEFVFPNEQKTETLTNEESTQGNSHNVDSKGLKEMCFNPRLRVNFMLSAVIWSAYVFNYYIIVFYLKYFPGDIYTNAFAMGLSDVFAYLISGIAIKKLSMSKALILALLASIAGSLLYLFLYSLVYLIPVFIILCRVGNAMIVNILYVSNNKLFPVHLQSSSFGMLNFISHVMAVGSPLVAEISDPYPFFVFVANAVISIFACIFVREISTTINK